MDDELQRIEKYLLDQLDPGERTAFLQELENSPALKEKFLTEQRLYQAVKAEGRIDLKNTLNEIHDQVKPTTAPATPSLPKAQKPRRRILPWIAAASFLLLLSLLWFFSRPATPQQLFAQNYQAYELSLLVRDSDQDPDLLAANNSYQQGEYAQAIPALEKAIATNSNPQLLLGLGISYLETGQIEKAKTQLTQLYETQDPFLKDQGVWYLGLIALQQNNRSQARIYLGILADKPKADHHEEAKIILEALN